MARESIAETTRQTPRKASARPASEKFLGRMTDEARRSVRYNHFFSVAVLRTRLNIPEAVSKELRPYLRSTDTVEVIEDGVMEHRRGSGEAATDQTHDSRPAIDRRVVATILPETDREGAQAALERLSSVLENMHDVSVGFAVYPDDSTDPERLLQMADPSGG